MHSRKITTKYLVNPSITLKRLTMNDSSEFVNAKNCVTNEINDVHKKYLFSQQNIVQQK
jgi:hypothetical protein